MNSIQRNIVILKKERGFHLVTEEIIDNLPEIETFHHGILNLFLLHTSASLTINENTDHRVQKDLERYFTSLVPEKEHLYEAGLLKLNCDKALFNLNWRSTLEFEETVRMTAEWYKVFYQTSNKSMFDFTVSQIVEYTNLAKSKSIAWACDD